MSDTDDPPSDEEVIDLCDSDPDSDSGAMLACRDGSREATYALASCLEASETPGSSHPPPASTAVPGACVYID